MYSSDFESKQKQRHVIMKHMNDIITSVSQETVLKIGKRTGSTFILHDSLEEQFKDVKLRGFIKKGDDAKLGEVQYRNVFEGFNSSISKEARKKWIAKERKRMNDRQKRQKKAEERKLEKEAKKNKKQGNRKGKKRSIVKTESKTEAIPRKKQRVAQVVPLPPVIEEDSKSVDDSDEVEAPLRGGALLFQRRKDRTLLFKENIDNE